MNARRNLRNKLTGLVFGVLAIGLMSLVGCGGHEDPWKHVEGEGKHVLVSFPPLFCFAKNVTGDHAKVMTLLTTVGPHDYTPSAHDAVKVTHADIFIVNGMGLDTKLYKLANTSGNPEYRNNKEKFLLEVASVFKPAEDKKAHMEDPTATTLIKFGHHGHEHGDHAHHHHHDSEWDPHVWLGVSQAKVMVDEICKKLSDLDPDNADHFKKNAETYKARLDKEVQQYGEEKLKPFENRNLVSMHESLKYFARSFGLNVVDSIQAQPGVTADAKRIAKLIEDCKKAEVQVITVEPQYSDSVAKELQKQLKGKVRIALVDTMETVDAKDATDADYYITTMRKNIDNLAAAFANKKK